MSSESIHEHYDDPENRDVVEKRFAVYDFAEPRIDIHEEEVSVLKQLGRLASTGGDYSKPVVLDAGSSSGNMLAILRNRGFQGTYVALDRSMNQLRESSENPLFESPNVVAVNGSAESLPIRDESVDIAFVNFMLYHQNGRERLQTYSELKRITKPDGIVIAGTSGVVNKAHQRMFEFFVANEISEETKAPAPMNAGFTSERAENELPANFRGWHISFFEQIGDFRISDEAKVDASVDSIRTARKLYKPEPSEEAFEAALGKVKQRLMQRVLDGKPLVDSIHRTFVVMSQEPTGLPERVLLS